MELTGDVVIGAPRERVWLALNDPEMLRACIPGCEDVQRLSDTETQLRAMLKMGPVRARFVGKIVMSEVRPDEGCVLNFEGSGGAAGFAKGQSTVSLSTDGSGTRLGYTAAATIGGKLGQVGGRMIDAAAKQMADQFFAALGQQLAPADAATEADAAPATGEPNASPVVASAAWVSSAVPAAQSGGLSGERLRVLWFVLGAAVGAACTAFGFWAAALPVHG